LKAAAAALVFVVALAANTSAHAQRIVESPLVAGWGFARCTDVTAALSDPAMPGQVGQWALGYYSGLLALDVEAAVPSFRGLDAWLRGRSDVATEISARVIAQCRATPELSVEVASQRVAAALAAESRR
jgi:hypothetical protein